MIYLRYAWGRSCMEPICICFANLQGPDSVYRKWIHENHGEVWWNIMVEYYGGILQKKI